MVVTLEEDADGENAYLGVSLLPQMRTDIFAYRPDLGKFELEKGLIYSVGTMVLEVVEDSPAAAAGLQEGDRITAVDEEEVTFERSLSEIIRSHAIGDTVSITVRRDGESMTLEATLAEHPDEAGVAFLGVEPPKPLHREGGRRLSHDPSHARIGSF